LTLKLRLKLKLILARCARLFQKYSLKKALFLGEFFSMSYMSARHNNFKKTVSFWDCILTTHPSINPDLRKNFGIEKSPIYTLYPLLQKIDETQFDKRQKNQIICTGAATQFRFETLNSIRPKLRSLGILSSFTGFSSDVDIIDNSFATLNIPQSNSWKYSSPNRLDRSLGHSLLPVVLTKFNDHPIESACVEFHDFIERFPGSPMGVLKTVNDGIEGYNEFAENSNAEINRELKDIFSRIMLSEPLSGFSLPKAYTGSPLLLDSNESWSVVSFKQHYYLVSPLVKVLNADIFVDIEYLESGLVRKIDSLEKLMFFFHSRENLPVKNPIPGPVLKSGSMFLDSKHCYYTKKIIASFSNRYFGKNETFPSFFNAIDYIVAENANNNSLEISVLESPSVYVSFQFGLYRVTTRIVDSTLLSYKETGVTFYTSIADVFRYLKEDSRNIIWKI
jgi:hypothetical protein